jgi:uncharacterized protein YqfA (UPF0365 family)
MLTILFILLLSVIVLFFWYFAPINLWYEAKLSGIDPGIMNLFKMRLQKIPQRLIISNLIKAHNSGLKIKTPDLIKNHLAGVDITNTVNSALRAHNAGIDINFNELCKQYLAKVDTERVIHSLITLQNAKLQGDFNELCSMYLSNVNIIELCEAYVSLINAGVHDITLNQLKEHDLSGGNVKKASEAYIAVKESDSADINIRHIFALDLTDIDVSEAVNWHIHPKIIETKTISGIASDGIQVSMKLKLTLKANIKNMIGGAAEQTVLARVDENLTTEIGLSSNHRDILKSPYTLAKKVEARKLGEGTAFDILSVDVSEVNVGKDVEAELLSERAKANAEKAKTDVIKAEEKVKKAMAAAFLDGNISVEKFNDLKNTDADTKMRDSIGDSFKDKKKSE